jgi:ribosomal protein S18 acetylase RimI-like enzyme
VLLIKEFSNLCIFTQSLLESSKERGYSFILSYGVSAKNDNRNIKIFVSTMISIKRVTDYAELQGIQTLQQANLKRNLSEQEAESQGFVTAEYSMDFLETLHRACPSIIAKDWETIAGYALVAVKSVRHQHELLSDLFNSIDKIVYNGRLLENTNYVIVGQLCVARDYRGLGLVQKMYDYYRSSLAEEFDYCITDVAKGNIRSLKAHEKSGFRIIDTLEYGGLSWDIILWDWKKG